MDSCLSYSKSSVLNPLPSKVKKTLNSSSLSKGFYSYKLLLTSARLTLEFSDDSRSFRPIVLGLRTHHRVAASRNCEFGGSLNTPLEPKSSVGRLLSGVLQNERESFHAAVAKQLGQLVAGRDEAVDRMRLSLDSDVATLHRRIAKLKEHECRTAVEDVLYMLIFYQFSEIRVHLVPKFSKCIYNGRLEVWPSKDWELESIHNYEVLEMIKEHLTTVVGWKANSSVTENWATTRVQRLHLCRIYVASILYGYFLKSATLRHHLELNLDYAKDDSSGTASNLQLLELSQGINNVVFHHVPRTRSSSVGQVPYNNQPKKQEKLRYYVMSLDPETLQMCGKPKSKEAVNLIEEHSAALFGDKKTSLLETEDVISTSVASLKRLVLEAIAFGCFLWDAEEYVNSVYKLEDN